MTTTIPLPVAQDSALGPARSPTRLSVPSPNQIARSLTGRDYLSFSQIRTFQTCPLKWHFQYVRGLAPEFTSSSLLFGSSIHAAIERYYRAQLHGEALPTLSQLLAAFDKAQFKVEKKK